MAINKFFIRYKFSDAKLNVVLQDLKRKTDELIDYTLSIDWGNLGLYDTDKSDILTLKWDEDDSNPRDFKFKVNKGDRTLDLSGNLTTESASILNQDYTTDASVIFGGLTINGDSNLDGAVTINEAGVDKDFRVEGIDYTHLLFADASTNRMGVNEDAPKALFHIRYGTCADYTGVHPYTALLLEGTTSVALQLQGSASAVANIAFADADYNPPAGRIQYDFNTDEMNFGIGTNILVYFKTTGAVFRQDEMEIDSTGYAAFIANAHNADAYFSLEEDEALKWTMGFDYTDSLKFQISEGIPGTDIRFEIEPGASGLINCYQNVAIRNTKGILFYDNGNYVSLRAPSLTADQIWVLPSADALQAGSPLVSDSSGTLSWAGDVDLGAGNFVTTGTLGCAGPLTITQNSDTIVFSHDGTDAWCTISDGYFIFTTSETGASANFSLLGDYANGGCTSIELYDDTPNVELQIYTTTNRAWITSITGALGFNPTHAKDIKCWEAINSGNPTFAVMGHKTAVGVKYLSLNVDSSGFARIFGEDGVTLAESGGKLGFYGLTTPIVQQAHIADSAGDDAATVNAILVVLENLGLIASA